MTNSIDSYQGCETIWSKHALKDSRASAMAILLAGLSGACAGTSETLKVPKSGSAPAATVNVPAQAETSPTEDTAPTVEEAQVPAEKAKPTTEYEWSEFAKDTRSYLHIQLCQDKYPPGVVPEIRGVVKGDNIEAIIACIADDYCGLFYRPGIKSNQAEKITGHSFTPGFLQRETGMMKFDPNFFIPTPSSFLDRKMQAVESFKNVKLVYSAEEGEGIKPDTDCNKLVIPYLILRQPPAVPAPPTP